MHGLPAAASALKALVKVLDLSERRPTTIHVLAHSFQPNPALTTLLKDASHLTALTFRFTALLPVDQQPPAPHAAGEISLPWVSGSGLVVQVPPSLTAFISELSQYESCHVDVATAGAPDARDCMNACASQGDPTPSPSPCLPRLPA